MKTVVSSCFRMLFSVVRWVDDRNLALLRPIPSRWKRRLFQSCFRLGSPLLSTKPLAANGMFFEVPSAVAYSYLFQEHEPASQEILRRHLRPGMRVVDVGANIGFLALLAARLVESGGHVYAVEPGEQNLEYLRRNIALNKIGNVVVVPCAAGASRRQRVLYVRPRGTLNSFYSDASEARAVDVEEAPLDELVPPPIDFAKIDVEGAELDVLAGMRRLLDASPRLSMLVEWNPSALRRAGESADRLPLALLDLGFQLTAVDDSHTTLAAASQVSRYLGKRLSGTRYVNLLASRDAPAVVAS